ncbi:hypothetical protein IMCC21906_00517 [Spongiibacter sp. IMCC21906]|nr:hypothetical protein IMCC21906_00517 [Spongiibacter sp. IMCC21906]
MAEGKSAARPVVSDFSHEGSLIEVLCQQFSVQNVWFALRFSIFAHFIYGRGGVCTVGVAF